MRAVEPQRRVGCGDDDPAAAQAPLHDGREGGLGRCVERGRRFVEQPKRAIGDEETGEGHPPPLPGREQPCGEVDHMRQADARQRVPLRLARGSAAEHRGGEGEVLACGQRPFDAVGVAEIMGLLADRAFGVAAFERKAAGFKRQEAAKGAQQARLSRPVRPGHDQAHALIRHER